MRNDIEFKTDDRVALRGWLYTPDGAQGSSPTIVMAHGYSAVKEMYLDSFAEVFCDAGFAVLVYDNRNLGASDGEPRGEIDPWRQINDYRDAITFAGTLSEVDKDRIGVWGSSYSGGHVIVVGALDRRVKCVVSQVPLISGLRNAKRLVRSDLLAVTRAVFDADREARYKGQPPGTLPVVSEDPSVPCALPTDDSLKFFKEVRESRAPSWRNEVTLKSIEMFWEYEPGWYISRICPTPFMLAVASGDHLVPVDLACEAFEQALEPKKLIILPGGHFDAYTGEAFKVNSAAQRDWFVQHLKP
jgi:fermentation-respiration switch protein FrsA (DUF1100 family)